jgi:hypothetical protein
MKKLLPLNCAVMHTVPINNDCNNIRTISKIGILEMSYSIIKVNSAPVLWCVGTYPHEKSIRSLSLPPMNSGSIIQISKNYASTFWGC